VNEKVNNVALGRLYGIEQLKPFYPFLWHHPLITQLRQYNFWTIPYSKVPNKSAGQSRGEIALFIQILNEREVQVL
jgi:hypothetical protein